MKILSLLVFVCISSLSFASKQIPITIKVIGPCSSEPVLESVEWLKPGTNLGEATVTFLARTKTPFQGNDRGMNSILGTPVGDAALEIFGAQDEKMRAYGWCFHVNGQMPLVYANEIEAQTGLTLEWFSSYALFDKTDWVSMCNPSWKLRPKFMCPEQK